MRPVRPLALALSVALAAALPALSQNQPKILRVNPFAGNGISPGEAQALQGMVTSYISEYKLFRVIDAAAQEMALKEAEAAMQLGVSRDIAPLAADYILSASAQSAGGLVVFSMDLTKVSSGEKRNVAKAVASVNDLILSLRGLTDSLFDRVQAATDAQGPSPAAPRSASAQAQGSPPASGPAPAAGNLPPAGAAPQASPPIGQEPAPAFVKEPSLAMITGSWSGDKGVDRVSILRDGRGVAVLSSGSSMKIKATIAGSSIVVVQDQPSSPEFYKGGGLDLKAAREVAAKARPWRWIFSLAENKGSLVGTKESVYVTMDKGAITVDNNYVREARWSRLFQ